MSKHTSLKTLLALRFLPLPPDKKLYKNIKLNKHSITIFNILNHRLNEERALESEDEYQ